MARLLIMCRPGIAVVSGIVKEVDAAKGMVLIENDCYLPVSRRIEKRRCRYFINKVEVERFRLKKGSFVMATVRPTPELELLMDPDGEDVTEEYLTTGYHMRFTGSFDFTQRGMAKEEHVFRGTVLSTDLKWTKSGRPFTITRIGWRKNGEQVVKALFAPQDITGKIRAITTGIFVTGEKFNTEGCPLYSIKRVVS